MVERATINGWTLLLNGSEYLIGMMHCNTTRTCNKNGTDRLKTPRFWVHPLQTRSPVPTGRSRFYVFWLSNFCKKKRKCNEFLACQSGTIRGWSQELGATIPVKFMNFKLCYSSSCVPPTQPHPALTPSRLFECSLRKVRVWLAET